MHGRRHRAGEPVDIPPFGSAIPTIAPPTPPETRSMPKFMLMLFDNPADYAGLSPQRMQEIVREYGEWAGRIAKEGKLVGGNKLSDEGGKVLSGKSPKSIVTDGPFAETKEVLGGYFIVEAADYDEAVAIARSCPHATYGVATHVRRIDEMS